jgi:hypothetical protein
MAEPRRFYKTVISFTVLSEEPIPEHMNLEMVAHETCDGRYVGNWSAGGPILLNGAAMVDELREAGSSPDFFEIDAEGNDAPYDFETVRQLTDDDPYK